MSKRLISAKRLTLLSGRLLSSWLARSWLLSGSLLGSWLLSRCCLLYSRCLLGNSLLSGWLLSSSCLLGSWLLSSSRFLRYSFLRSRFLGSGLFCNSHWFPPLKHMLVLAYATMRDEIRKTVNAFSFSLDRDSVRPVVRIHQLAVRTLGKTCDKRLQPRNAFL